MAEDNEDNIVLEQLRPMRNEIREMKTDLGNRLDRLETRMSSMEHTMDHMYAAPRMIVRPCNIWHNASIASNVGWNYAMTPDVGPDSDRA